MYHHDFNEKIGFWYVIALAGQSNGMAYGEGIPLPDTLDKPESRVKQLARRKTITREEKSVNSMRLFRQITACMMFRI